jgi:hypothetical protein
LRMNVEDGGEEEDRNGELWIAGQIHGLRFRRCVV